MTVSTTRKAVGIAFLVVLAPATAYAITADVARTCNAAVAKAFPLRQPGNPAAGSSKGTGKDQRVYFEKCVGNGGKVDDSPEEGSKNGKSAK